MRVRICAFRGSRRRCNVVPAKPAGVIGCDDVGTHLGASGYTKMRSCGRTKVHPYGRLPRNQHQITM